jgi:hypothetical protein
LEPRDYEEANAKPLLPRVNFNWIQQQQGTTRNNKEQQGTTRNNKEQQETTRNNNNNDNESPTHKGRHLNGPAL